MITQNSGDFGDIQEIKIKIGDDDDIMPAMRHFTIYMDIFTPCWTLVLEIDDTTNLITGLPITQGAPISVFLKTKTENNIMDGEKTFNFMIYKISDKIHAGQMQQKYTIYAISKDFLINQTKRIKKCYRDKKPEQIVSNIVDDYFSARVETGPPSENNYHVIIPNWSPYTAISWCAKLAIKKQCADYLFFMKDEGNYWFRSFEEIYKEELMQSVTLIQKPSHLRTESGDLDKEYAVAITKYKVQHYDVLENLSAGYYKNKVLSYNVISKQWEEEIYSFDDDVGEDVKKKPWQHSILDGADDANVTFLPKHPGLHENKTIDDYVNQWHSSRKVNLMKLEQDTLQVQLRGGIKVWEWLGKSLNVELPRQEDKSKEDFDKYFKGQYMVTHIGLSVSDYINVNLSLCKKRHDTQMRPKTPV